MEYSSFREVSMFQIARGIAPLWNFIDALLGRRAYATPVSSEISDFCEISDLLLFFSYFSSQNNGIKFGVYFFDVFCVN